MFEMQVTLIGIDLAKNVFQVCGVNQAGKTVFNRQVRRSKLMELLAQYPNSDIAMEACSGSNYWRRSLTTDARRVMLISPQYVKPFVKGNKNDRNDAFAITEAARRPELRFTRPKTLEQTDIMLVHRIREQHMSNRTALINQIRGLLTEYGVVVAKGKDNLRQELPFILEDADNELTTRARQYFSELIEQWQYLDDLIKQDDWKIKQHEKEHEAVKRIATIKGVGEQTASALFAYADDGTGYKNGRQFSASLGLVPKEHSSGGKQNLGGITKRGDSYIRMLLTQCAWSVIRHCRKREDRLAIWARQLVERRGSHKAALAIANKLARIVWAMLHHGTEYKAI